MKLQTAHFYAPDRLCTRINRGSNPLPQSQALKSAGCAEIFEEQGSGGDRALQVLGAAAEFERALIRERTKAGLASARTKGRVGGNPGLRAKDPAALRKVRLARQDGYMERLNETSQDWVPHVRRLRPDMAWEDVLRIVNAPLPEARRWTQSRLLRAVKAYVRDGFLSE